MRIIVKSKEKNIRIILPTRLVANRLTAGLISRAVNKKLDQNNDIKITPRDIRRFIRELYRVKRKYPKMHLVEVDSSDGEKVRIKL